MLRILICAGLSSAGIVAAARFDPPDLTYEAELHRQFLRARKMESVLAVPSLAKDAYVENYRIQQGETLWSLSRILYGDGNYWPRVWSQNSMITNPHLIRPGHTLQFLMGSEDDTPAFRITEEGGLRS
ncbi:MAG: LysM peptidoglycan-binding domain-containing protein [Calothrix sp. SM1_5_4]|nr:LysM peptidoglycan-binding domain-containing protein [Calothrix sp. SM1_5_4]